MKGGLEFAKLLKEVLEVDDATVLAQGDFGKEKRYTFAMLARLSLERGSKRSAAAPGLGI